MNKNFRLHTIKIEPVKNNEPLARYILESSQFSRLKKIAKPSAFMPAPNLQLSVFRIDGLDQNAIWELGEKEVVSKIIPIKTLYGMAELLALSVKSAGLRIDADDTPLRHANIIGWPKEKDEQKIIAIELATKASLVLKT